MTNITFSVHRLVNAILITTIFGGYSQFADAGDTYEGANCYRYEDGSGECGGTFAGFRNNSDPDAYAEFRVDSYYGATFYARLDGWYYGARASSPEILELWDEALSHRGNFWVKWDASHTINRLILFNGSRYSSF